MVCTEIPAGKKLAGTTKTILVRSLDIIAPDGNDSQTDNQYLVVQRPTAE